MADSRTITSTQLPEWLTPYAQNFINAYYTKAFGQPFELGNVNGVPAMPANLRQRVAGFNPQQLNAMGMVEGMTQQGQNYANNSMAGANTVAEGGYLDPNTGMARQYLGSTVDTAQGGYFDPSTGMQSSYLNPTMATAYGAYMNGNPYLDSTYNAAARRVTDNYSTAIAPGIMAAAGRSGAFGGSAMNELLGQSQDELGQNLGDMATNMYGQNYQQERNRMVEAGGQLNQALQGERGRMVEAGGQLNQAFQGERGRMMQALQMTPELLNSMYMPAERLAGTGALQQEQQQNEYNTEYQNAVAEAEYPFDIMNSFAGALGPAAGGAAQSQTQASAPAGKQGGFMGSVICTELHRQGAMDDETYEADSKFGQHLPPEVVAGYYRWAVPVARAMRSSRIVSAVVRPVALRWALEMKKQVTGKGPGSWLGRILLRYGVPICGFLGRRITQYA